MFQQPWGTPLMMTCRTTSSFLPNFLLLLNLLTDCIELFTDLGCCLLEDVDPGLHLGGGEPVQRPAQYGHTPVLGARREASARQRDRVMTYQLIRYNSVSLLQL